MKRTGPVFFVLAIVLGAVGLLVARGISAGNSPAGAPSSYRVDVVFDTAKGVIPGQVAKVAGARVGRIEKVSLTPDYKARIELSIDGRFAPFRADASCSIQPEGLISERFVQCDPGTQSAPALRAHGDEPPTVPVTHTTVPVGLTDLFGILDAPAEQRLRLLLSELGAGVSGEGSDLNGILLRAAPTLQDVRKVLTTLRAQRTALNDAVTSTDRAVAAMVGRRERLRGFIDSSSRFLSRTATRRRELSDAVRRLPPLLDAAQPALERLHTAASATTPVLRDLRSAAPSLDTVLSELPSFSSAGTRALGRLDVAAGAGLQAIRRSAPVVRLLETFAAAGLPTGESLARTLVALRDSGTLDGALSFVYNGGATLALYDDISHIGATRLTSNACVPNLPSEANPAVCPSDQATIPQPSTRHVGAHKHHAPSVPQLPAPPHVGTPPVPKVPALPVPKLPPVKVPGLPPIPVPQTPTPPPGDSGAKQVLDWLLG